MATRSHYLSLQGTGFGLALVGVGRVALTLLGLAATACVVVTVRWAVFEYFHGQVLRSLLGD
jgi:nicotinamidase-related amidase